MTEANRIRIGGRSETEITVELPDEPLGGPFFSAASWAEAVASVPAAAPLYAPRATWATIPLWPVAILRRLATWTWRVLVPPPATWISLGVPQAIALTSPRLADDDDLRHFFVEGGASYFLVHLACSFNPGRGERISNASVAIALSRIDGEREPAAVAWSMEPLCLAHVTELSRSQKIDAKLKIIGVSLGAEQRSTRTECLVQAFNELQPDPRWEFRHASGVPLRGTQRLIMVVQAQAPTLASVTLVS